MAMVSMVVGGVTNTTATFVVKVGTGPVRIAYSTDSGMASPTYSSSTAVDAQKVAKVSVSGLTADTQYYWQVEDNSTLDTSATGKFKTFPVAAGNATDFTFVVSGDAGLTPSVPGSGSVLATTRLSNHPIFDTIRQHTPQPLFFAHLGDLHYYDLGSGSHSIVGGGSVSNYRRSYDDVLLQARQHQLYRELPLVYVWDDHDYGPNDSDGTLTDKANAATAYRERVPHYTLPDSDAIYHSFHVGRVLFVVSDTRYDRSPNTDTDNSSKSMIGTTQKAWLENLLDTDTSAALVWLMPSPWLGVTGTDTWAAFSTERTELAEMLETHGWADKTLMINGDSHINAYSAGSSNSHGGWPVAMVGGLDATYGTATQYDVSFGGRGQYAAVNVYDRGGDVALAVTWYKGSTVQHRAYLNTGGVTTTVPDGPPIHALAL